MKILFKNITALNKDEYLELIKFHGKKNNLKYYSYTAVMGLILIIGMSYQIILKNMTVSSRSRDGCVMTGVAFQASMSL